MLYINSHQPNYLNNSLKSEVPQEILWQVYNLNLWQILLTSILLVADLMVKHTICGKYYLWNNFLVAFFALSVMNFQRLLEVKDCNIV